MKQRKQKSINTGKEEKITRKQAIKKVGYSAFTAATMMLLLNNPAKGQGDTQSSPAGTESFDNFEEW